jgi:hypothetical protein
MHKCEVINDFQKEYQIHQRMEFKLSLRKKIYDKLFYEIHLNDNLYNRNKLLKFIQEKHRDDNEEENILFILKEILIFIEIHEKGLNSFVIENILNYIHLLINNYEFRKGESNEQEILFIIINLIPHQTKFVCELLLKLQLLDQIYLFNDKNTSIILSLLKLIFEVFSQHLNIKRINNLKDNSIFKQENIFVLYNGIEERLFKKTKLFLTEIIMKQLTRIFLNSLQLKTDNNLYFLNNCFALLSKNLSLNMDMLNITNSIEFFSTLFKSATIQNINNHLMFCILTFLSNITWEDNKQLIVILLNSGILSFLKDNILITKHSVNLNNFLFMILNNVIIDQTDSNVINLFIENELVAFLIKDIAFNSLNYASQKEWLLCVCNLSSLSNKKVNKQFIECNFLTEIMLSVLENNVQRKNEELIYICIEGLYNFLKAIKTQFDFNNDIYWLELLNHQLLGFVEIIEKIKLKIKDEIILVYSSKIIELIILLQEN